MARPVKKAMSQVESAAAFYHRLGIKVEKYGVRITIVNIFPKPVIDIEVKDEK